MLWGKAKNKLRNVLRSAGFFGVVNRKTVIVNLLYNLHNISDILSTGQNAKLLTIDQQKKI